MRSSAGPFFLHPNQHWCRVLLRNRGRWCVHTIQENAGEHRSTRDVCRFVLAPLLGLGIGRRSIQLQLSLLLVHLAAFAKEPNGCGTRYFGLGWLCAWRSRRTRDATRWGRYGRCRVRYRWWRWQSGCLCGGSIKDTRTGLQWGNSRLGRTCCAALFWRCSLWPCLL